MTISGERTEQLDILCHVTGFTSDFLSFIDVELIQFFHGAIQLFYGSDSLILAACQMSPLQSDSSPYESRVQHTIEKQLLFCGRDQQISSTLLDKINISNHSFCPK